MTSPDRPRRATELVVDGDGAVDQRVLAAVAVTDCVDTAVLATLVGVGASAVRASLDAATAAGLVMPTAPHLSPDDRRHLLAAVSRSVAEDLHDRLLGRLVDGVPLAASSAAALVESGCRDPRLVRHLLASFAQVSWPERTLVVDLAEAAGADPIDVAAHRAEIAAALGDFDQVLRCSDVVLSRADHAALPRAARAAAVAHAHRGMTTLSAQTFRFLGDRVPVADAPFAIWAHLGVGDTDVRDLLESLDASAAPTSTGRGTAMVARGLCRSFEGDGTAALPLLVQASTALLPMADGLVMPDSPAALAALLAIGHGELDTADQVLVAALHADLGGSAFWARHHLLRAWVAMLRGQLDQATSLVDLAVANGPLSTRDDTTMHAVRVGIARRGADTAELISRWHQARECLPHLWVDLYSLLTLGELSVAAGRLRESFRVESHLADATALLHRLGDPPAWGTMFHWYGVHASFAAEDRDMLLPHAEALAAASSTSRVAAQLASVGRTWVRALANDVDVTAVQQGVRTLASLGLNWDAGRLAARAAASTPDRRDMLELMHLARATQHRSGADDLTAPVTPAGGGSPITEREWEVARMVIDGLTYREIGDRLFISPKTVEHHVARIRRRLGAGTRQEMLSILRTMVSARQES